MLAACYRELGELGNGTSSVFNPQKPVCRAAPRQEDSWASGAAEWRVEIVEE